MTLDDINVELQHKLQRAYFSPFAPTADLTEIVGNVNGHEIRIKQGQFATLGNDPKKFRDFIFGVVGEMLREPHDDSCPYCGR